jgi:hemerythrin-like domain-containing protein
MDTSEELTMSTNQQDSQRAAVMKMPAFEHLFEQEHILTERILDCGRAIVKGLREMKEGDAIPPNIYTAMAILVYLNDNFADQTHLAAEEAAIPIAVARGMSARDAEWVYTDHDQGRAYAKAADIAWKRINAGDQLDVPHAIDDFARCTEGLVNMFEYHAEREDRLLFPEMARHLSEADDDLIMHVIRQIGPPDVSPYIALVVDMEEALGIPSPPADDSANA